MIDLLEHCLVFDHFSRPMVFWGFFPGKDSESSLESLILSAFKGLSHTANVVISRLVKSF